MKTSSGKSNNSSRSKSEGFNTDDLQKMAEEVIEYIETHARKLDKVTLAKYAGIAVLVIYGLRKSNVLGSIALSLVTGMVTKFITDQMEGQAKGATD